MSLDRQNPPRSEKIELGELVSSTAPAVVALLAGLWLASSASSNLLRLLGLGAAVLPLLLLRVDTLKRALIAATLVEIVFPVDIYLNNQLDPDELGAIATINPEHVNAVAGINISVTTFCLVVLYVFWIAERLAGRREPAHRYRAMIPAVAYVAAVTASLLVAQSTGLAFYELVIIVQAFLLMLYVVHFVSTRSDLWFVLGVLMVALLMQALLVIAQAGTGLSLQLGPIGTSARGARVAGTVGSPNTLGGYLSLMAAPALGIAISGVQSRIRFLGLGALFLGSIGLFLTASRGAWAGFGLSMVIMAVVAYRRGWIPKKVLITGAVISGLVVVVILGDAISERFATGSTLEGRLDLIEIAFSMIGDHPLLGVGSNNFAASIGPYVTDEFSATWISTVHNKYLLVWAETGIIALIAFLWMLGSNLVRSWRTSAIADRALSPIALGLGAGVVANMVHMTVELYHGRQQTQMLWIILALIIAVSNLVRSDRSPALELSRIERPQSR